MSDTQETQDTAYGRTESGPEAKPSPSAEVGSNGPAGRDASGRISDSTIGRRTQFQPGNDKGLSTRFQPGNTDSMRTGIYSKRVRDGLTAEARAVLSERRNEILADLGGDAEVAVVKRVLVTRFVELTAIADMLAEELMVNGVLTSRGKRRAALAGYLGVVATLKQVGASIGLERRPKPTQTLESWMEARAAARLQDDGGEPEALDAGRADTMDSDVSQGPAMPGSDADDDA